LERDFARVNFGGDLINGEGFGERRAEGAIRFGGEEGASKCREE
jgi:hypothetical protein